MKLTTLSLLYKQEMMFKVEWAELIYRYVGHATNNLDLIYWCKLPELIYAIV